MNEQSRIWGLVAPGNVPTAGTQVTSGDRPVAIGEYGQIFATLTTAPGVVFHAVADEDNSFVAAAGVFGMDVAARLYGINGEDQGSWDAPYVKNNLNTFTPQTRGLMTYAGMLGYDATADDGTMVMPTVESAADALPDVAAGNFGFDVIPYNLLFDGVTWNRMRSASATVAADATKIGVMAVDGPGDWSVTHAPAANTIATITRAAGGAGVRHKCTSIMAALTAAGAAATPALTIVLRDGATGVGTILWSATHMAGLGFADEVSLAGLNIVGSANTAMTLEFSAAPGAGNFASVAMTGHDVI